MSREFNNGVTTDLITYPFTTSITGAQSLLMVARIMDANDAIWISFMELLNSGNSRGSVGRRSNGNIYFSNGAGIEDDVSWTDADNWCVIAATKAAGSNLPTFYKIPIGGSTTTASAGSAFGNNIGAPTSFNLGGPSDGAYMRLAVASIFNVVLTQAEIEGVASAKTTASIDALSPLFLADDGNNFDEDYIGSLTGTKTGTTNNGDNPSGWVYGLSTPQFARPTSDVADGSWTNDAGNNTNLYASIDETAFSDADYIQSSVSPASADIVEVGLSSVGDPAVSTGHIARYRYKKSAAAGDQINLTVRLMEGATQIASWTHTNISDTAVSASQTLTGGEADAITNYSNLRYKFEATKP